MRADDRNHPPEIRITEHFSGGGRHFINFKIFDVALFKKWLDAYCKDNRLDMVITPRHIADDRSSHVCYLDEQKHLKK